MRLWHYELIPYLPKQQLLGQWRECMLIAKNLAEKGTPNHILVNRILDYPAWCFENYCQLVAIEIHKRGYKINSKTQAKLDLYLYWFKKDNKLKGKVSLKIFEDWHNRRYLDQCFYNLQEKYDCGGITENEFNLLQFGYEKLRYGSLEVNNVHGIHG